MTPDHVWADDLTGAAEVADLLARRAGRPVVLSLDGGAPPAGSVVVHDLELRHATDAEARAAITARLAQVAPGERVFLKVDSQLHGPVAGYLAAMVDGGRRTLLSAANPALGRTTEHGVHQVVGAEGVTSTSIPELLGDVPHRVVDRSSLLPLGQATAVLAADAADEGDLDALAALAVAHGLDLAGGAALLAALLGQPTGPPAQLPPAGHRLVAVVGSTEAAACAQVAAVRERDRVEVIEAAPATAAAAAAAIERGKHVVLVRSEGPETLGALAAVAAELVAALPPPEVSVLLTGGHTARLVLDRLGICVLTVVPDRPGAVVRLRAPSGLTVFTKPGSYGGPDAIAGLIDTLHRVTDEELR
jgi:uncharacterized protein YgbK (DUF1537 family)